MRVDFLAASSLPVFKSKTPRLCGFPAQAGLFFGEAGAITPELTDLGHIIALRPFSRIAVFGIVEGRHRRQFGGGFLLIRSRPFHARQIRNGLI
jgi:hypothetical protein